MEDSQQILDKAYADCFLTEAGKLVFEDLFWSYFETPLFSPGESESAQALAFREGQRSVVLGIRASMRRGVDPGEDERPEMSLGDMLDFE